MSDTETCDPSHDTSYTGQIAELKRALAKYEQAELPEEPSFSNLSRFLVHGGATEVVLASHYDALRAHAAANERAEKAADAEKQMRGFHKACIKDLYEMLGVDGSDGEIRYKWAALAVSNLKRRAEAAERRADENARDAERYRFVRKFRMWAFNNRHLADFELDAAIDAARNEEDK